MRVMEEHYPQALEESWDANGLIVGDPDQQIRRVLLAVDPVDTTVAHAIAGHFDVLITHHPLFLRGTTTVSRQHYKGRLVHDLIRHDIALFNAHTNADAAHHGVAWALAQLLDITGEPLETSAHQAGESPCGLGRIGELAHPVSLREFAMRVADRLPAGPHGIFVGVPTGRGLDMPVRRVAVSPGAGDSFLARAAALGADVYVTADLRHHPASEHLEQTTTALICGSHWATESVWLPHLRTMLINEFGEDLHVEVSERVTEPWALHIPTNPMSTGKL